MAENPQHLRYSREHEWIRLDGDTAYVGVTDFAQQSLGDIVFIELPAVGKMLAQNDSAGVVESVKAVSPIYSPVSGAVVAVNEALESTPESVNADPYGAWFFGVKLTDLSEWDKLLDAAAYGTFCE